MEGTYQDEHQSTPITSFQLTLSIVNVENYDNYEEDDPDERSWVIPDLEDGELVALDGDILLLADEPHMRKGIDFDEFLTGLSKWRDGIVYYWFGQGMV